MTPQSSPGQAGQTPGAPPAETPVVPPVNGSDAVTSAQTPPSAKTEDATTEDGGATAVVPTEAATPDTDDETPADVEASAPPVGSTDEPVVTPAVTEVIVEDEDDEDDEDDDAGDDAEQEILTDGPAPVTGSSNDTLIPLVGTILALVAVAALLLAAFVYPATKSGPHRLPLGVAGPASITGQVKSLFAQNGSTAFEVKTYSSENSLRKAIKHRNVYGGLNVTETGGTMLIASAGSVTVADALNSIASQLGAQVTDVVPAPAKDPRGAGLAASGLPLLLAALLPALLLIRVYRTRPLAQLGTAIATAILTGAAASALLTFWLGSTQGANFWLLTLGLSAAFLSVSLILLGLNAVGGRIGVGIGLAVLVLVSVPLAGLATAPEWLPQPWGDIGQFLPAGAAASLLRSSAFFDGHGALLPLAVLGVWALAGLLLLGLSEGLAVQEALGEDPPEPARSAL